MSNRTERAAFTEYLQLQQTFASCFTLSLITHDCRVPEVGNIYSLHLNKGMGVVLRTAQFRVAVNLDQRFEIAQAVGEEVAFNVQTIEYYFTVKDANTGTEIIAYHWHPTAVHKFPHLHLGAGAATGKLRAGLDKAHLPTGPVSIHEVILMLIRDFKVPAARPDAEAILERRT